MVNSLTEAREAVADALVAAGLNAYAYVEEVFTTPAALVVPDSPYIGAPVGQNPFSKPYSIRLMVLLVTDNGSNESTALEIDLMVVKAVNALDEDWDVTEVLAPHEVTVRGVTHLGSLVSLGINTNLTEGL